MRPLQTKNLFKRSNSFCDIGLTEGRVRPELIRSILEIAAPFFAFNKVGPEKKTINELSFTKRWVMNRFLKADSLPGVT